MNFWETVLSAFLASLLAIILGGLHTIGAFRRRRPKEPPLDKGFIPWLGYAIQFRKSPAEFLERMRKKHGDIFTVLVGGNYINFVADPHTHEPLMKEPKEKLDFEQFSSTVVHNAFGFQPTQVHHQAVQTISKRFLNGQHLNELNQVMMEKLQISMLKGHGPGNGEKTWHQAGLFHFSYKTIFQAGFLSLFGTKSDKERGSKENSVETNLAQCAETFEIFHKFDHYFPQLAVKLLDPAGKTETQKLQSVLWDILSVDKLYQRDDINSWVVENDREMVNIGMTEKMRTQFLLLLLWASQANTGPATFWIILFLLKHPEAMKAVREELDRVLKETGQEVKPGNPFLSLSLDKIKTPLLDSAIQETLRLKGSVFIIRGVMEDIDIKMGDGKEYTLRKGDTLFLFPYIGLHMDPEIYPEPQTFKYDRFINPDGTKKEFYKNGKLLKHYIMPFGGGSTMCPGRYFAVSEMKMFVILMLVYFDMELVNAEEDMPPTDEMRCGFGAASPSRDIQFRYRLRCSD
ncbi:5-beta-cholestane-3-alpha,7-alpha-diol 12-alpha-hydroxylase-like [Anolis sagrei]|uniref:5-beta-cholestane-3-alpha,7-alpha-diol 12-alpha-hydroxylase-like n=1 Tax=Anolis sagrei TaxID=38937 RepID=UPI0035208ACD